MPRTVHLLYSYRKKHGGSKFHLSFVRPFGPDFAPALPRALDLFLYFDIVFSIILDLAGHVRYGQTTDEEVAQPMRCKHSGLILPAPKRRKNNSLNPAAKRLDNNLLLQNLSLNNSNFCQTESSVANMVPFTQRRNQKHFGGKTPYHRKLLEAN